MARNEEPVGLGINGVIPGAGACVIEGCRVPLLTDVLMCDAHWASVPPGLQQNVRYILNRWRRNEITLAEVRAAQWACVEALQ